jgi:hypothetical protein
MMILIVFIKSFDLMMAGLKKRMTRLRTTGKRARPSGSLKKAKEIKKKKRLMND